MEQNDLSLSRPSTLHYSSEIHPYVSEFRYICIVHQAGVSHHNEVFQTVFAYKLIYRRQQRVAFIFVALMDAIGKRIAAKANKQAEYDLRITVTSLL